MPIQNVEKYWSDWTAVAGQQFEYGFDDIGNRQNTKAGGDENGVNLRPASYTVNSLNQYTQRTVPGYVDIKGVALANNSVTVNSQTPYRRGEYFRKQLSVGNGSASVWQGITVAAPAEPSVMGNIYVPKTPEVFSYDADGNLTQDGRWNLGWDGENRLIRVVANTTNGSQQRIEFKYDWQGRRIGKKVWNNTAGTGSPALDQRFVYDGWNLIAIVDSSSSIRQSFVWGTDLSGTMQGAGGVGGLLAVNDMVNGTHFVAMDGNGNVAGLVKGTDGTASANYEYGPFDEPIRVTGAMSKLNPFRFSTKYQDDETDWLYYGYRYYDQSTGRWLSRDPINENGGVNLYGFVNDNPIVNFDLLGLDINQITAPISVPSSACCREEDKVTIYVVNRGGPVNQAPAFPGLPGWTGGHIDLVIPGCGIGMVGFYGDTSNNPGLGGLSKASTTGVGGVENIDLNDWLGPKAPRPNYLLPPGMALNTPQGTMPAVRSYICEIRVCPWLAKKMCERAREMQSNPPEFSMAGRNCSSRACEILNAGAAGPAGGISGIDNPQDLQKQLGPSKCYYGYTAYSGISPQGFAPGGQIRVVQDSNQAN